MAQAQTKRDKIVEDIVTAIKAVKTTNGYHNTIADTNIERARTKPMNPAAMPAVVVWEEDEETVDREYGAVQKIITDLTVTVELWTVYAGAALATEINELEGDITKAVMADPRRNGNALYTEKAGSEPFFVPTQTTAMGGREITFVVRYIQQEGDPFA